MLGTKWEGDVKNRYERSRESAQKKVEQDAAAAAAAATAIKERSEGAVVSEEPTDSNARTRLRRKTLSTSVEDLKGVTHGVASSVLQA